jgi:hypothetical protein
MISESQIEHVLRYSLDPVTSNADQTEHVLRRTLNHLTGKEDNLLNIRS